MSGMAKCFALGFFIGTPCVLTWLGVPYVAAMLLVLGICVIAGYRFDWQDRTT